MGMIPKKLKQENVIIANITLRKVFVSFVVAMAGALLAGALFGDDVGYIRFAYIVCSILIYWIVSMRAPGDRRKLFYESLLDLATHFILPKKMFGCGSAEYKDRRHKDEIK